jgi:hypothetical protein
MPPLLTLNPLRPALRVTRSCRLHLRTNYRPTGPTRPTDLPRRCPRRWARKGTCASFLVSIFSYLRRSASGRGRLWTTTSSRLPLVSAVYKEPRCSRSCAKSAGSVTMTVSNSRPLAASGSRTATVRSSRSHCCPLPVAAQPAERSAYLTGCSWLPITATVPVSTAGDGDRTACGTAGGTGGGLVGLHATDTARAVVPGLGKDAAAGVLARSGVRDRQVFVLGADGSYDVELNRFFRELDSWGCGPPAASRPTPVT